MAQQLAALAFFQVPEFCSQHPCQRLTSTCELQLQEVRHLLWPLWAPVFVGTHLHPYT